jgi:hypothetical protein
VFRPRKARVTRLAVAAAYGQVTQVRAALSQTSPAAQATAAHPCPWCATGEQVTPSKQAPVVQVRYAGFPGNGAQRCPSPPAG